ncbi:sensor histidine kinase, partial [Enterococcus sp.]
VVASFTPLIFLFTRSFFFTNIVNWRLASMTVSLFIFPAVIVFILIHQKMLKLPTLILEFFILLFCCLLIVSVFQILPISSSTNTAIWLQVLLATSLTFTIIRKWHTLQRKQLQQQQRTLSKEQSDLLNQVTYSDFLHNVSTLLTSRLCELTQSENFLFLTQKKNEIMTLSQKGWLTKEDVMPLLPDFYTTSKVVERNNQSFKALRVRQAEQILWLFFEQSLDNASDVEITAFLQQYSVITKTVRLLHDAQKQSAETSLNLDVLLQEKLFTSIEREKMNYTHYLHDEVLQTIIALNTLMHQLEGDAEIMELITLEFTKLIASIRNEIFNTAPSTLYHIPFEDNVAILIQDFNQRYPDRHFQLRHRVSQQPPEFVIAPIYRIIKELNENSAKHAHGTLVETTLEITAGNLTLTVEDDGIGIASLEYLEKELIHKKGHIGLLSIKNDVNWLNGTFEMIPSEKHSTGTKIKTTIPLEVMEVTNENTIS